MKYYFDTCIWMDYYGNRYDSINPIGFLAFDLINNIVLDENLILCSEVVIFELSKYYSKEEIKDILSIVSEVGLLVFVEMNQEQRKEAILLSEKLKIGLSDCSHAILARDNQAILVTRDKHFDELKDVVDIKKPEELIF